MYDIMIGDYDRTYSSTVVLQYRLKIYLFGCKTSAARDFKSKYSRQFNDGTSTGTCWYGTWYSIISCGYSYKF